MHLQFNQRKIMVKTLYLLVILLFLLFQDIVHSQSYQWKVKSLRRTPTSIHKLSNNNLRIYAGEISYRSTDNGLSWSDPIIMNPQIGTLNSNGFPESTELVYFSDSLIGWACQYNNVLQKTTNGGNTWANKQTGINNVYLQTIFFINNYTGWAGGWNSNNNGILVKTTNGGINWNPTAVNFRTKIRSIFFLDSLKGFLIPSSIDTFYVTSNGGISWNNISYGIGQRINKLTFTDQSNGWILGDYYFNLRTTNSGGNWQILNSTNIGNTFNFSFINNFTGWITGPANRIWKTTNAGVNWIQQLSNGAWDYIYYNYILDLHFNNNDSGWVLVGDGSVLKSTNGGTNWNNGISPPYGDINWIHFSDQNTGVAISNYKHGVMLSSNNGYIWKTTNGGNYWSKKLMTNNDENVNSLQMVDASTGYVVGSNKIYKTTNNGDNWSKDSLGNNTINSVFFLNVNTGWIAGHNGTIYFTSNGGNYWIQNITNVNLHLNSIQFVNINTGFACGESGVLCKTTNSGINWLVEIPPPVITRSLKQIYFINANTGFLLGNKTFSQYIYSYTNRILLRTTNQGSNWTSLINDTISGNNTGLNSVYFINDLTGFLVNNTNQIYITTNFGNEWGYSISPVTEKYFCVNFINSQTGWIGGSNGLVLSTGFNNIGISSNGNLIPMQYLLFQNYPNPFNPVTNIKFNIPKRSNVKISIYDILGKEISVLVNEELNSGTFEVNWDASNFPSGVYFYKIETDEFSESKKMVLVK